MLDGGQNRPFLVLGLSHSTKINRKHIDVTGSHCTRLIGLVTLINALFLNIMSDPIAQFFPDQEDVDLYAVLNVFSEATNDDIRKAYRRLALTYHPDKHSAASEEAQAQASTKFQQVGFAYAVLSDEKRRKRYDSTGQTDEGSEMDPEGGWEAYFEELFDRVTRGKLDEMKKEYQGALSAHPRDPSPDTPQALPKK